MQAEAAAAFGCVGAVLAALVLRSVGTVGERKKVEAASDVTKAEEVSLHMLGIMETIVARWPSRIRTASWPTSPSLT
ncbi:hypothetical protein NUW54_g10569 [Trametes sanguinea]|uniref:Uncharacterized protein n=1 Tax=Trametes sanguinea TaxID=158606 RepID=A0ACC1NXQ8_9APHY|nr:hypothetical protein NUW54_g10569 [Trametes sanguinea]